MMEIPRFAPVTVTRAQIVAAARRYLGIPYHDDSNYIRFDADERPHGRLNCYGLLLRAVMDLGYLPGDFDIALGAAREHKPLFLLRLLRANFARVAVREARPGDVLLLRYALPRPGARSHYHVALKSADAPAALIHAVDTTVGRNTPGRDKVQEQRLSVTDAAAIKSAWQLPGVLD